MEAAAAGRARRAGRGGARRRRSRSVRNRSCLGGSRASRGRRVPSRAAVSWDVFWVVAVAARPPWLQLDTCSAAVQPAVRGDGVWCNDVQLRPRPVSENLPERCACDRGPRGCTQPKQRQLASCDTLGSGTLLPQPVQGTRLRRVYHSLPPAASPRHLKASGFRSSRGRRRAGLRISCGRARAASRRSPQHLKRSPVHSSAARERKGARGTGPARSQSSPQA